MLCSSLVNTVLSASQVLQKTPAAHCASILCHLDLPAPYCASFEQPPCARRGLVSSISCMRLGLTHYKALQNV